MSLIKKAADKKHPDNAGCKGCLEGGFQDLGDKFCPGVAVVLEGAAQCGGTGL